MSNYCLPLSPPPRASSRLSELLQAHFCLQNRVGASASSGKCTSLSSQPPFPHPLIVCGGLLMAAGPFDNFPCTNMSQARFLLPGWQGASACTVSSHQKGAAAEMILILNHSQPWWLSAGTKLISNIRALAVIGCSCRLLYEQVCLRPSSNPRQLIKHFTFLKVYSGHCSLRNFEIIKYKQVENGEWNIAQP